MNKILFLVFLIAKSAATGAVILNKFEKTKIFERMTKKKTNPVKVRKTQKPSLLKSLIDPRYIRFDSKSAPTVNRKIKQRLTSS